MPPRGRPAQTQDGDLADSNIVELSDSEHLDPDWERGVPRTATGVKDRAARLRALGNAVVPQVAQVIGEIVKELI